MANVIVFSQKDIRLSVDPWCITVWHVRLESTYSLMAGDVHCFSRCEVRRATGAGLLFGLSSKQVTSQGTNCNLLVQIVRLVVPKIGEMEAVVPLLKMAVVRRHIIRPLEKYLDEKKDLKL